jgi:hypothetical protein
MANVNSTKLYVPEQVGDLEVYGIYKELMKLSVGQDSVYIKSKETLIDLFENSGISDEVKATMIAQTISTIATSITDNAMKSAIAIAKENREGKYSVTKVREDTLLLQEQRDKVAQEHNEIQLNGTKDRLAADKQIAKLTNDIGIDTRNMAEKEATGLKQRSLVDQQILGEIEKTALLVKQQGSFDDSRKQKLFDSSINGWALMYSSGLLEGTAVPDFVSNNELSTLYTNIVNKV